VPDVLSFEVEGLLRFSPRASNVRHHPQTITRDYQLPATGYRWPSPDWILKNPSNKMLSTPLAMIPATTMTREGILASDPKCLARGQRWSMEQEARQNGAPKERAPFHGQVRTAASSKEPVAPSLYVWKMGYLRLLQALSAFVAAFTEVMPFALQVDPARRES
jgi:hypothetical protein